MDNSTINQSTTRIKSFVSNKSVFLISIFSVIIPSVISILTFNDVDIKLKITICLGISCIVLLCDVIYFYIKEREYYYVVCYLENNINLLQHNIEMLETKYLKKN